MRELKEIIPGYTYPELCQLKATINNDVQIYLSIGNCGAAKIINYDQTLTEFIKENRRAIMKFKGYIIHFKAHLRNHKPIIVSVSKNTMPFTFMD